MTGGTTPRVRLPRLRRPNLPAVSGIVTVLRLLWQLSRTRSGLFAAAILARSALPVTLAVCTGLLIGSIPATVEAGLESAPGRRTLALLVAVAVLVLLQGILGPLMRLLTTRLGRELDRFLQETVMTAVSRPTGITHLEDPAVLADIRTARGLGMDASRPSQAVEALPWVLPSWLQALGSAALLIAFHWWLGLLWLLMWPVVVYVMQREYLRVGQVGYGQSKALRRSEYLRDLALTPTAAKELRLWGMLDWLIARFETTWLASMGPVWQVRRPRRRMVFGTSGVLVAVNLLSYGLLAWAGVTGDITLGALAVYLQALDGANAYNAFNDDNALLSFAAVSVPKVLELDDRLTRLAASSGDATTAAVEPDAPRSEIRFEGLTFNYPGSERNAITGLDLVLPAHRSLAIVGDNGAGKTTVVKLLCRLYEPTTGRIRVDGAVLSNLDPSAWRSGIAVLFQDFAHYHLPARDNVALGAPHLADDTDRLRTAVDKAGVLDLIEALPNGWDTVLSREYEGGIDLSGGQWQRIALARALFAVEAGARVLVLDEPSAALDVRAEADLYDRFLDLTRGLTTVLISHRFSTVRRAERIVVLADGAVVEDGSHDELLDANGRYAHMFRLQAERFRAGATEVSSDA